MSQATAATGTLIRTKLHAPAPRELVPRHDALGYLRSASPRRLTLVRAPAGWGKSSLVSAWAAAEAPARPFAWVSLDRSDNDPVRFFLYVIEALRTLSPAIGERSRVLLVTPGMNLVEEVLPELINEMVSLPAGSALVIDDYHLIASAEVHEAVSFLLDRAPAGFELVISTRTEPPLEVARHRARGELREIAVADLSFSVAEATGLLNDHHGLDLDPVDVARLVERTEGWAAGLYMAALSLRGRDDAHDFIATFAGDDRNVVDYLTTEVLNGQSADVHDFLLSTSVLDQLCPELCDAVTDRGGSAGLLRRMEDSNSFVIALDDKRRWYRYHHLFRDLLLHELRVTDPDRALTAHRRAAGWLLGQGDTSEAILHTIAAGDVAEAVEMVAAAWRPYSYIAAHQTIRSWLEALPPDVHRGDARLCVASAVTAIGMGHLDEVGPWIEQAARAPAAGPFHDGFSSGVAAANCLRSVNHWLTGDLGACRASALTATDAASGASPWDPVTYTWLGAATYWLGDSDGGLERLGVALERCRSATVPPVAGQPSAARAGGATVVACLGLLALVHLAQGAADLARQRSEAALELSSSAGLGEYWVNTAAHTARAGLLSRSGRAHEARVALDRALEVGRRGSGPVEMIHALVARGLIEAERDRVAARAFVAEARSTLMSCADPGPVVSSLVRNAEDKLSIPRRAIGSLAPVIEPFSERELDVLRLLGSELSQREIGDALFISFNTVKSHSKSLYRKLGVGTRREAVDRARGLDLL